MDMKSAPAVSLTEPQRRTLAALIDLADEPQGTARIPWGYARPREIAKRLWPDSPGWTRRSDRGATDAGGALGATMPMKAATLLWRLHRLGLADHDYTRNVWEPTSKGRQVIADTSSS